tara:strand:- start:13 stop:147 length:135 start_codon:yes stop_codon:yes gene_type:complete
VVASGVYEKDGHRHGVRVCAEIEIFEYEPIEKEKGKRRSDELGY